MFDLTFFIIAGTTLWAEPFCNYISEGSVSISTGSVTDPLLESTAASTVLLQIAQTQLCNAAKLKTMHVHAYQCLAS